MVSLCGGAALRARGLAARRGGCSRALPTPPAQVSSGSDPVPWLVRDGDVLCSLTEATSFGDRLKGLLGRDGVDGALLLRPAKSVHTVGMRFAIDVAFCDRDLVVVDTVCLRPQRMTRPRRRARCVIEAEAGAFERWGLRVGDRLEVR